MFLKKINKILIGGFVASTLMVSQAYAASYVSGTSTGGNLGKALCNGSIATYDGEYAIAATNVNTTSGIKAVKITLHYTDASSESDDFSGYDTSVSGKKYRSKLKPLNSASAKHSFSSKEYGKWYGKTSKGF
ncbi:hypothetical protein [Clostridium cochlearium]|uniref:Uncharacterized protein n=1 Tax=Clostridium cochlearium TaxID=1494 RepID=A0A2X2W0P7_CLOCO|nr:hypothetical protein [Clostridium cochlearium]SQB34468.1 Uncharacterised protein [Clostridium cochlearium]